MRKARRTAIRRIARRCVRVALPSSGRAPWMRCWHLWVQCAGSANVILSQKLISGIKSSESGNATNGLGKSALIVRREAEDDECKMLHESASPNAMVSGGAPLRWCWHPR